VRDLKKSFIVTYRADDIALSEEMVGYWTSFAKTGDPNGGGSPKWPPYVTSSDQNIELAKNISVKKGLDQAACDLADRFYGYTK
jgi:para-nitrobenzyl esterase